MIDGEEDEERGMPSGSDIWSLVGPKGKLSQ